MQRPIQRFALARFAFCAQKRLFSCAIRVRSQQTLVTHQNTLQSFSPCLTSVIGLEVHAQLLSCTKLFSRTPYSFGLPPNTQLSLFDAAIPGSLPLINRRCVEAAVFVAFALNSHINLLSRFDRKHYFYSDLPSGYQITQYFHPIAEGGYLDYIWSPVNNEFLSDGVSSTNLEANAFEQPHTVSRARIKRLQIEQDTGKSLHDVEQHQSLIDLNRSDVPLVEIVTEPDFTSSSQVIAFVKQLSTMLAFVGSCNANASLGELRVDVNVSIGPSLTEQGPRVEVKNINSIRGVANAIDYEIRRQTELVRACKTVNPETRSYDPVQKCTLPMRDKQSALDYRYLPEPNLPFLHLASSCSLCHNTTSFCSTDGHTPKVSSPYTPFCLECAHRRYNQLVQTKGLGELPNATRQRLLLDYSLEWEYVCVLVENVRLKHLFDSCRDLMMMIDPQFRGYSASEVYHELAYWICGQLHGMSKRNELIHLPSPNHLAEFVYLNLSRKLHGDSAVKLLCLLTTDSTLESQSCLQIATDRDWLSINDPEVMRAPCARVLNEHPKALTLFQKGQEKKAIKRLMQYLLKDATYEADKFHPLVLWEVLLNELRSRSVKD